MQKSRLSAILLLASAAVFFKLGGCSDSNTLMKNGRGETVNAQLIERNSAQDTRISPLAGMKILPVGEDGEKKKDSIKVTKEDLEWLKGEILKRPFPMLESKHDKWGNDISAYTKEQYHEIDILSDYEGVELSLRHNDIEGAKKYYRHLGTVLGEKEKQDEQIYQKLKKIFKD